MNADKLVILEEEEGISVISLNDQDSFNSLSIELLNQLFSTLKTADEDQSTKTIILKGIGRGFSAGHNLKEIQKNQTEEFYRNLLAASKKVMTILSNLKKPIIAEVHGVATAAGCQLVAACDLAYSDSKTKFATPGVNIGVFCHTPLVSVSRTIAKKHSMEMLLLGEFVNAADAKRFGLINDIFEPKELSNKIIVSISFTFGKFNILIFLLDNKVAAKIGREEFFDPEIFIIPLSFLAPTTCNFSIFKLLVK